MRPTGNIPTTKLLLTVMILLTAVMPAAAADCTKPMTMAGKKSLYQRVLTRPGASAAEIPGADDGKPIITFSRLYVYERRNNGGAEWLRVGTDDRCRDLLGWVPARDTVEWKQQLTLALTNPAGRDRMLFFRDWDALKRVLDSKSPAETGRAIAGKIDQGGTDPGVVALEPATFVDLHKQFYLLPILDTMDYTTAAGRTVRALKVASVSKPGKPGSAAKTTQARGEAEQLKGFRAAIVFVIDSTISMQPYIDETRDAVEHFYDRIKKAGLLDKVSFGLVGFRAKAREADKRRQLEYLAKVFASPTEVHNVDDFMAKIASFSEAGVSTDYFDEDPYAGIAAALETKGWKDRFGARHIVLITDAGALDGTHNRPKGAKEDVSGVQSDTRLDAASVQALAARSGVGITVMHLRTPEANRAGNVARAETQYRVLSMNAMTQQQAYFPIENGSRGGFRKAIDDYANTVIAQMEAAGRGQLTQGFSDQPPASGGSDTAGAQPSAAEIAASLGHAMQLAYLGERQQTAAPEVFEAWIADTDLADAGLRTVLPHVLMTRNQLSNLREIVQLVVEHAEADLRQEDTTKAFYDRLASIAATFERNPQGKTMTESAELVERDQLLEYLDGLPYKSDVLELKKDDWTRWGIQRQSEFVDRMKKKVRLYSEYYGSLSGWIDIAQTGDSYSRQSVHPVPLRDLP